MVGLSVVSAAFADRGTEMAVSGLSAAKMHSAAWTEDMKRAVTAGQVAGMRARTGIPGAPSDHRLEAGHPSDPALCACVMPVDARRLI
ncbi:hypothetical protein [Roseivivax lentus]|uniref:hypothetical protein n=1 Tax=Roseivivax lentus TaxID=633194 RepID=UPI0009709B2A|nr:hypothetical protein [Roseivivax lentus]